MKSLPHLWSGHLEVGWEKDKALQDEFAKRDQVFLDDITDLCRRADRREQVVSDITDKLQQEIVMLASLLETVAERRPLSEYTSMTVGEEMGGDGDDNNGHSDDGDRNDSDIMMASIYETANERRPPIELTSSNADDDYDNNDDDNNVD